MQLESICTIISSQGIVFFQRVRIFSREHCKREAYPSLRLLVLGGPIGRALSYWEEVIMTRNMAVPR